MGKKRKNKYNRKKKPIVDGITFDSKLEANQYGVFKEYEDKGIKIVELQPKFNLLDGFRYFDLLWYYEKGNDRKYRGIEYTPDFKISIDGLDREVIWETKGRPTEAYEMRKKMWYNLYGEEYYFIQSSSMKHQRKVLDEILERVKS